MLGPATVKKGSDSGVPGSFSLKTLKVLDISDTSKVSTNSLINKKQHIAKVRCKHDNLVLKA